MNFNNREISGETPLKKFPERYNGLISDLNIKITELEDALDKKNTEIDNLKKTITSLEENLKASFGVMQEFDQKLGEFDQKMKEFDQKLGEFDQKMKEFEDTFEKKTN